MYLSVDIGGTNIRVAKSSTIAVKDFKFELVSKRKLSHIF